MWIAKSENSFLKMIVVGYGAQKVNHNIIHDFCTDPTFIALSEPLIVRLRHMTIDDTYFFIRKSFPFCNGRIHMLQCFISGHYAS